MALKKDGDPSSQSMFQNVCKRNDFLNVMVFFEKKLVKVVSNWHAKGSQDFIHFSNMILFHSKIIKLIIEAFPTGGSHDYSWIHRYKKNSFQSS